MTDASSSGDLQQFFEQRLAQAHHNWRSHAGHGGCDPAG
jgi:hypothetical protein